MEFVISNILNNLRNKLKYSNEKAFDGANLINRVEIDKEISKLEKIVKNGGSDNVPKDRIVDALLTFFKTQSIKDISQARLVCYGLVQKINQKTSLIENRQGLVLLLDYVETYKEKTRPFRRCYKGLLNNYFIFNPKDKNISQEAKLGWADLKEFLYDHRNRLSTNELNPEWVETLIKHENLLQENPCSKYGLEALKGDRSVFDEIRNKLEIQDDSWVVQELVNAQVDSAVKLKDQDFKDTIENLLDLLQEHDFVNECLGKIINRYTKCVDTSVNTLLRDFSVARWKNPWLKGNEFRWATVSSEGKQMISTWLKLHLITEFFAFLSEDGSNDTRRVDFWKAYHNDIEDMYFALGPDSYNDDSLNAVQIRKEMAGLLMKLDSPGASSNNAFIMKIRDYYFVEFGKAGNAAYVFDSRKTLPFKLMNAYSISGDSTELKNKNSKAFVHRFIHKNSNYGTWEDEFEEFLKTHIGVKKEINKKLTVGGSRLQRYIPTPTDKSKNTQSKIFDDDKKISDKFSMPKLKLLANQNNLQIQDHQNVGGNIWVYSPDMLFDTSVSKTLESWSFSWSERKRAYFK